MMTRVLLLAVLTATGLSSAEQVRRGNDAARSGSTEAGKYYAAAEDRIDDPGLVAFNRAALAFSLDEFREAELDYLRCLEDRAIPAERRRRALFNRGICLVRRDDDARLFHAAIRCFEECLRISQLDDELARNARLNLELAKMLWNRERLKSKETPLPNERDPEELPRPAPSNGAPEAGSDDPGSGDKQASKRSTGEGMKTESRPDRKSTATNQLPKPGSGSVPVVKDDADVRRLTQEDTQAILDRTESRIRTARKDNEKLRAGPERPHVRDW